jgi:ribosomal protein S18 acetylase RimI-like enzyme
MTEATIRQAYPEDLNLITLLFEALIRDQMSYEPFFKLVDRPEFRGLCKAYLAGGNNLFFIAEAQGRPVGFIRLNVYHGAELERVTIVDSQLSESRYMPRRVIRRILSVLLNLVQKPDPFVNMFEPVRTGYIADLYVAPGSRKLGIGSLLVAKAMEWFRQNQVDMVQLRAVAGNRTGVSFWEKQGFEASQLTMRKTL